MRSLSIKAKMLAVFALITLALAVVAVIAIRGVSLLNDDLSELYQERLVPVSQLARINDLMHVSIEQLTIAVIARPSPQNVQKYIERVETNLAEIDNLVKDYARHVVSDEDNTDILASFPQCNQILLQQQTGLRVESGKRFIHQEHRWITQKGANQSDALLHA